MHEKKVTVQIGKWFHRRWFLFHFSSIKKQQLRSVINGHIGVCLRTTLRICIIEDHKLVTERRSQFKWPSDFWRWDLSNVIDKSCKERFNFWSKYFSYENQLETILLSRGSHICCELGIKMGNISEDQP